MKWGQRSTAARLLIVWGCTALAISAFVLIRLAMVRETAQSIISEPDSTFDEALLMAGAWTIVVGLTGATCAAAGFLEGRYGQGDFRKDLAR